MGIFALHHQKWHPFNQFKRQELEDYQQQSDKKKVKWKIHLRKVVVDKSSGDYELVEPDGSRKENRAVYKMVKFIDIKKVKGYLKQEQFS